MTDKGAEGPTIYSVVMDERTEELYKMVRGELDGAARQFVTRVADEQTAALRQAYIRGVRDGFAQGVQAATEREPESADSEVER